MIPQSFSTAHTLLILLLLGVSLGLSGPRRHKHVIRDIPSALTSTQAEDQTTQYYYFTESSLPPFWPPRPTPHSSTDSTSTFSSTTSPEYPYNTDSDTITSSTFTIPTTTWNFTTPYTTWTSYSDTWGDHNTYPTPSSAATDETTTISVIKTLTSFTTTVVSKTVKPSSTKPTRTSSKSFTFKTTPFANLTTFTSPKWTTVPIASLTGTPFCSNAADPENGVGNHCVCENGETVGVIPLSKGGNASDYQPCAYTTVG